jgi:hypothetical protein
MTKIKCITTLALLWLAAAGYAQTIDGQPIKELKTEYIKIIGFNKPASGKMVIDFDYGQKDRLFDRQQAIVKDENNNIVRFGSMISALNFMIQNGYDFVQAYSIQFGDQPQMHYLLRKRPLQSSHPS